MALTKLQTPVLVLDAGFQPVNVVPARRAMILLYKGKAVAVEESEQELHSADSAWKLPRIIRLVISVAHKVYRVVKVKLNRKNLFGRDRYRCQYCGDEEGPFTIDHVVPKSRKTPSYPNGGPTTWENCVTACIPCNRVKGGKLLSETDMKLQRVPREPHWLPPVLFQRFLRPSLHPSWNHYLFNGDED